ncbi:hypothetical protein NP493_652g03028 [Ridgeia piscesae]|uniref:Fibrinogen C-terminal domain-containing protein n=1 Tax=Ridgeia piscesae TaxID=27915 RepID=A0AAD9NN94_RIDPI|nr:hypothetical protein NP493_652g03028 [Ridgeia piscesae]
MLVNIQQEIVSLKEELSCNQECTSEKEEIASKKEEISSLKETLNECLAKDEPARDCTDIHRQGHTASGVYTVHATNSLGKTIEVEVYCDMSNGGGWLVFQRRQDGSVDFYRNWAGYKAGFGNPAGEFWLGNDHLHELTSQKTNYTLRIDIGDWNGETRYAEYPEFRVGPEKDDYIISFGNYSGTAGDALGLHNHQRFSTLDRDNDVNDVTHCPRTCHAGWWFEGCYDCNLNGFYYKTSHAQRMYWGIQWSAWRLDFYYSFMKVEMKFRR